MMKHGELFESEILVYVQPLNTLCPQRTQTRIHRTQLLHYDKSLKRSSLRHIVTTNFASTIYSFALRDIVATKFVVTICRSELRLNNLL